jgi:hypothetical protein
MYVVTLVAKEPTPYPEDRGFVQCYEVEMIHQISKESTLSPLGYGAVYFCKINQNSKKSTTSPADFGVLYFYQGLAKFLRNLLSLPQVMAL